MSVTLSDGQEIEAMIDSREWWMFIPCDPNPRPFLDITYELELKFFTQPNSCAFVLGPPPRQFAELKLEGVMMMIFFGRKSAASAAQLHEFLESHKVTGPDSRPLPAPSDERDIIWIQVKD